MDFKLDLVILPKGARMNSEKYCNHVLVPYAHPFYMKIYDHRSIALWQEDGALYHTLKASSEFR